MKLTLLKDVASPWGTLKAGESIEVPDDVGGQWVTDAVGLEKFTFAPEDVIEVEVAEPEPEPEPEQETVALAPKENTSRPPPSRRGKPRETRA